MKVSRYNILLPAGNVYFLYNSRTDYFFQIAKVMSDLYTNNINNPEKIKTRALEFYNLLYDYGFIVSDNADEVQEVVDYWKSAKNVKDSLNLTINPTLNCNLKCWYCYEKHSGKQRMTLNTQEAILRFIERETSLKHIKQLNLSFFGGEPLLCYKSVIKPLLGKIRMLLGNKVNASLHFTTNSTLLTDEIINELLPWQPSFQIAIDGDELFHNIVKHINGISSYQIVLNNIKALANKNLHVAIRLNYTAKTLERFYDVLFDLKDLPIEQKSYCSISFHRIWQDTKIPYSEIESKVMILENAFRQKRFFVNSHTSNITSLCYADIDNHYVINYDGRIFRCTARDFKATNAEGILCSNGLIKLNDRAKMRSKIKFGNQKCHECNIFPICHGSCSQFKMESLAGDTQCYMNFTENGKAEFVIRRIKDIINEHKQFNYGQNEKA